MCSLNSQISLASKKRAPIRDESAPLSLSLVTGITMFFWWGNVLNVFGSGQSDVRSGNSVTLCCVVNANLFYTLIHWIILNTAFAQSVELSEGRKIHAELCQ